MTRRLVDVSQDIIVREVDCFEAKGERVRGLTVQDIVSDGENIEAFQDRIRGRVSAEDLIDPATGETLVKQNELINHDVANRIVKAGVKEMNVRSVLTCRNEHGVCARCYGANMPGHYGVERVTVQNLEVVKVDAERNLLLIKGAVPGANGALVLVRNSVKA